MPSSEIALAVRAAGVGVAGRPVRPVRAAGQHRRAGGQVADVDVEAMQGGLRVRVRDRAEVVGLASRTRRFEPSAEICGSRGVVVARRAVGARRAADERRGAGDAVAHDHVADGVRVLGGDVLRFGVERDVAPVGGDRRVEAGALRAALMPASVNVRDTSSVVSVLTTRTNTSVCRLPSVSTSDRFLAREANAMTLPSADIRGTNAPGGPRSRRRRRRPADQHVRPGLQVAAVDEPLGLRRRDQVRGRTSPTPRSGSRA